MNQKVDVDKKRRNRGVCLDPSLVRSFAKALNLCKLHELEAAYYRHFEIPPDLETEAVRKAWTGKVMEKKHANQVAQLLGLDDFTHLLVRNKSTTWLSVLSKFKTEERLFDWILFEDNNSEENVWRNVSFSLLNGTEADHMRTFEIDTKWHLTLYGEAGDQFAIFLHSDRQITQLAPRNHPLCKSVIEVKQTVLNFPEKPLLQFAVEDGVGKRTLIVIRAKHIPLTPKAEYDNQTLTSMELEQFGHRLAMENNNEITINICDFMLR